MSTITLEAERPRPGRTCVFLTACCAHALHDGLSNTLTALLPTLQAAFGLNYAAIGVLRALYTGSMAGLQLPSAALARRVGRVGMLAAGTAIAGVGYLCLGASGGLIMLGLALVLGGIGSSTQHPIASSLIASAYEGRGSRNALGTYNFAGDLGKMVLPALAACLIAASTWRTTTSVIGVGSLVGAIAIILALRHLHASKTPGSDAEAATRTVPRSELKPRGGFPLLLAIGIIDSSTRDGFLTFLPFILKAKGASTPEIGLALSLLFAGGAAGKLVCGFLGGRFGVLTTVLVTEGGTAAAIMALLPLPMVAAFALMPVIGIALNGTSSVLYGTVPELVETDRRETAFGVFYTATIGAGALSPILYGFVGDAMGLLRTTFVIATVVLVTLPLAWKLNPLLVGREKR
jgi:MFS transporter, FSR family, fosmidomycin resistance protein